MKCQRLAPKHRYKLCTLSLNKVVETWDACVLYYRNRITVYKQTMLEKETESMFQVNATSSQHNCFFFCIDTLSAPRLPLFCELILKVGNFLNYVCILQTTKCTNLDILLELFINILNFGTYLGG